MPTPRAGDCVPRAAEGQGENGELGARCRGQGVDAEQGASSHQPQTSTSKWRLARGNNHPRQSAAEEAPWSVSPLPRAVVVTGSAYQALQSDGSATSSSADAAPRGGCG